MTEKEGKMNTTTGFWADLHRHTLSQVTIDKSNLMWCTLLWCYSTNVDYCCACTSARLCNMQFC